MSEEEEKAIWYFGEVLVYENDMEQWKIVENLIDKLQKENIELKKDISNMYNKEVVISIICDNFDVTRLEALEMLGEEE